MKTKEKKQEWRNVHYIVRIGKDGTMLYCDSWEKVILWLNSKINKNFICGDDIRYYNECNNNRISIETHLHKSGDVKDFYINRRSYVMKVQSCTDFMTKAQRLTRCTRRDYFLKKFQSEYDAANELWEKYPEVWMGEI